MKSELNQRPLVCKLTGPELQKRKNKLLKSVFREVLQIQETENGYRFRFAAEDDLIAKLLDFVLTERECCPFFQFDITFLADKEGVVVEMSGPPGAKEMIEMMMKQG